MTQAPEYLTFAHVTLLRSAIVGIGIESRGEGLVTKFLVAYTLGGPIVIGSYPTEEALKKAYGVALAKWKGTDA